MLSGGWKYDRQGGIKGICKAKRAKPRPGREGLFPKYNPFYTLPALWFLLRKGVSFDLKLVNEKLKYYKMKWSREGFFKAVNINEKSWEVELKPLVKNVPEFKDVKKFIREKLGKA